MPEPLSADRLQEIRDLNVDSCSGDGPYNPDVWTLERARTDLLTEVDYCHHALNGAAQHVSALIAELDALTATVERLQTEAAAR